MADLDGEGRLSAAMSLLRRILHYRISVGGLIEVAMWLAIPYLCIGGIWVALHPEQTERIAARVEKVSPAGADVAAFGLAMALWPAAMQIADACPPS